MEIEIRVYIKEGLCVNNKSTFCFLIDENWTGVNILNYTDISIGLKEGCKVKET